MFNGCFNTCSFGDCSVPWLFNLTCQSADCSVSVQDVFNTGLIGAFSYAILLENFTLKTLPVSSLYRCTETKRDVLRNEFSFGFGAFRFQVAVFENSALKQCT